MSDADYRLKLRIGQMNFIEINQIGDADIESVEKISMIRQLPGRQPFTVRESKRKGVTPTQ